MATYNCMNDEIVVSASGGGFEGTVRMKKSGFTIMVVIIDIFCTLIYIAFYKVLTLQQ